MEEQLARGLVIAPMGIGEVLDGGFTLARRNFRLLGTIAAWGIVPGYALQVLVNLPVYATGEPARGSALAAVAGAGGGIIGGIARWVSPLAGVSACPRAAF